MFFTLVCQILIPFLGFFLKIVIYPIKKLSVSCDLPIIPSIYLIS